MKNPYRKYQKVLAAEIEHEEKWPIEPWSPKHTDAALHALVDSDRQAETLDNTPQALYGRYEFRDGAAHVIASVWGLDLDNARDIMQLDAAWADYQDSLRETAPSDEYEIRKVISEWRTEHSGWVYAPNEERALEIARDFQGDDVIVRKWHR